MKDVRLIPQPEGGRVETGVVRFGDDWAGVFIRGDNSFFLATALCEVLKNPNDCVYAGQVQEFARLLLDSNENEALSTQVKEQFGLVVERQTPTP
jgi:hypothetical protein